MIRLELIKTACNQERIDRLFDTMENQLAGIHNQIEDEVNTLILREFDQLEEKTVLASFSVGSFVSMCKKNRILYSDFF